MARLPDSLPASSSYCVSGAHLWFFPLSLPTDTALSTIAPDDDGAFANAQPHAPQLRLTIIHGDGLPATSIFVCLPTFSTPLPAYTFTAFLCILLFSCSSNYWTNSSDCPKEGEIIKSACLFLERPLTHFGAFSGL